MKTRKINQFPVLLLKHLYVNHILFKNIILYFVLPDFENARIVESNRAVYISRIFLEGWMTILTKSPINEAT